MNYTSFLQNDQETKLKPVFVCSCNPNIIDDYGFKGLKFRLEPCRESSCIERALKEESNVSHPVYDLCCNENSLEVLLNDMILFIERIGHQVPDKKSLAEFKKMLVSYGKPEVSWDEVCESYMLYKMRFDQGAPTINIDAFLDYFLYATFSSFH